MEILDVIKEYGDTRVKNAELEAENKVLKAKLEDKLKNFVKKQDVLGCLYKSSDGQSIGVEAVRQKELIKLLDWEY